jgi:predicted RNase H-like HicB family nuclease
MENVIIEIYFSGHNYSAHVPILPGCVSTCHTLDEIQHNMIKAIKSHVELSLENNDPIPEVFKGDFKLDFKLKYS